MQRFDAKFFYDLRFVFFCVSLCKLEQSDGGSRRRRRLGNGRKVDGVRKRAQALDNMCVLSLSFVCRSLKEKGPMLDVREGLDGRLNAAFYFVVSRFAGRAD